MNLLAFIDIWADPCGWIHICAQDQYFKAMALVQSGDATWQTLVDKLETSLSFNPRESMLFPFLPPWVKKAKVTKFVITSGGDLLVFVTTKEKKNE